MTIQDLTNNKSRIVKIINYQITKATQQNIKSVMVKMVAMLPQFADDKATMSNIDKLTMKAISSYLKYDHVFNPNQLEAVSLAIEIKKNESMQSSLRK
jgi:glucokinase